MKHVSSLFLKLLSGALLGSATLFILAHLCIRSAAHGSAEANALAISFGLLSAFFWFWGSVFSTAQSFSTVLYNAVLGSLAGDFNAVGALMTAAAVVFSTDDPVQSLHYIFFALIRY